jgi:prolipoprotein diacylglyceryltransferase
MAANLGIFGLLTIVEKRRRGNGYVFFVYLALYCIYRFLVEIIRKGATANVMVDGLTQAQVASLALLVVVFIILALKYRRGSEPAVKGAVG